MIEEVVKHYGGKQALARALGVSAPAVTLWCQLGRIPPRRAIEIERMTGGKFKAVEIAGGQHATH